MKELLCAGIVLVIFLTISGAASGFCTNEDLANIGPACGEVISIGLTENEIHEVVMKHNQLRSYVASGMETRGNPGPQPAARNMKDMYWDDQLACVAQRWANLCQYGHDPIRADDRFYVGQNIGMTQTTGTVMTTPANIIQMWYDEVSKMDRNLVPSFQNVGGIAHYTQIVWANTDMVGCGKIVFQQSDGWKKYYFICNYGPGGNFRGESIYQT